MLSSIPLQLPFFSGEVENLPRRKVVLLSINQQTLSVKMGHPYTEDSVWYNKFRFDDAEKQHQESVAGTTQSKPSVENDTESVKSVDHSGIDPEIIKRVQQLEIQNKELKLVTEELRAAFKNILSEVAAFKKQSIAKELPATGKVVPKKVEEKSDDEDEDEDIDLFGSDDDEDEEKDRIREERVKKYAEKKSKKPSLIAKSNIILDVKPWDDETNMQEVEKNVRSITKDGLLWGASKFVEVGYGIKKLQISCVVVDDKISVDELEEDIVGFEDHVQSVDIAAFNKEHLNAENYKNVGNFLALIKLVAQFDPLLAKHVPHAEQNPGSVSYLSPEIQNEFIHILASTVKSKLLSDIRKNKYYAILIDSTPDLGHREQLSQVIRFVDVDFQTKKVAIKESFLGYIEIHSKDAASLEKVIVDRLKSDERPLANCRAQCYDNAAVMTGHISGLQKRICDRNHRALFVNCDNHSLNLAGVHSAKQDPVVVTFFASLESIYSFFSHSTIRWEELKRALPITVKRESETRWSARPEAVKAIHEGLDELVRLLEKLSEDSTMTPETRSGAQQLF
ncbi:Elongation factor 1-delta [Nymphon striatum]|nr:Elongation factor 1-delta [Nymphon striatum]